MSLRQSAGLLATHPRLLLANAYRFDQFVGKSENEIPPDFHIAHVRACLKRSQRRYRRLYAGRPFEAGRLLREELRHYPCGRKSLLYMAVRLLKPQVVVETGVWIGLSTSQILQALADNGGGELYSIDAPNVSYDAGTYWDAKLLPKGRPTGFAIPRRLCNRWELIPGYSTDRLPALLERLGSIDLFFHDSTHNYETMFFEYRTAWPFLNDSGVLISDDVHVNPAFADFSSQTGAAACTLKDYGIALQQSVTPGMAAVAHKGSGA